MRELLARMSDSGVRGLSLNTQADNRHSQAFYTRLGFHPNHNPTSVYRYML
jgi:ribosomal protein S18 acetylase RimI-like enzyme